MHKQSSDSSMSFDEYDNTAAQISEIKEIIGQRIKKAREAKNYNQNALAIEVKMSNSQISVLENGKVEPRLPTLIKIAKALDVSVDYLLGLSSEPKLKDDTFENSIWLDGVPPIQALIFALDHFRPEIIVDTSQSEISATVHFKPKFYKGGRDCFRDFFLKYNVLAQLTATGLDDITEETDSLTRTLIKKYKKL